MDGPTYRRLVGCESKQRYESQGAAQRAIRNVQKRRHTTCGLRAYHCPDCSGWHLTSRERSQ